MIKPVQCDDDASEDGSEELDNFEDVCESLEKYGWYRGRRELPEDDQIDWSNPVDFIRYIFGHFSDIRRPKR